MVLTRACVGVLALASAFAARSASEDGLFTECREAAAERERSPARVLGPRANPDDQIRGFWLLPEKCYAPLRDAGFNTFIIQHAANYYDITTGKVRAEMYRENLRRWLELTTRDGTDYIEQFVLQQAAGVRTNELYFIRSKDGTVENPKNLDANNPALQELFSRTLRGLVAEFPDPAPASFVGIQSASEVRGHQRPSYTEEFKALWRAASGGKAIPAGCTGTWGPNWKHLKDFPSSRLVRDDDPILAFYQWFYRSGDGWNRYLDEAAELSERRLGRPIVKMYDPIARQPPIRGYGDGMTLWNQWHYPYPEPYNVSYIVSELQALNRLNPDRQLAMMVQGISYRRRLAPKEVAVENAPAWLAECPNVSYMTTPPDMACEAFWTLFSRKLDGVMFYGCRSLFDLSDAQRPKTAEGYQFTNGETMPAVGALMTRVGVPLGPLFRAIPERPMDVAVLESFSTAIFADGCDLAFGGPTLDLGTLLTAANLAPGVLYEEDLCGGGVPDSVKVLFLPRCEVLTKATARAIRAFKARGGIVFGDRKLAPGVVADFEAPAVRRAYDAAGDQASMRAGAAQILQTLAPYYRPYGRASTDDIRVAVRSYGSADYVFAINDRRTAGDYVGQWGRVFEKGLPVKGSVTIRRAAGAVYDLVRHTPVPFVAKDGETTIEVDLAAGDGAAFLVTERPLAALKTETDGSTVRVTSPDTRALVPIGLFAAGRKPRYGVVRDGFYRGAFAGQEVKVVNLADGSEVGVKPVHELPAPRGDDARRTNEAARPLGARPACAGLPPSQDPGFDHELKAVLTLEAKGSLVLPAKPVCDAVELRFGAVGRMVKVHVNGVLAAVYDPKDDRDAVREFRFEANTLLKWGERNEIRVTDQKGDAVEIPATLVALRII